MIYKSYLIRVVCTCIVFASLSAKAATVIPSNYLHAGDGGDTWTYEELPDGSQTTWTLSNITSGDYAGFLLLGNSSEWIVYDVIDFTFTIYETENGIYSPPFNYPSVAETDQMYTVSGEEFLFITSPGVTVQAGTFSDVIGLVGLDSAAGPNAYNTLLGLGSHITAAVSSVRWYASGIGLVEAIGVNYLTGEVDGGMELVRTTLVPAPLAITGIWPADAAVGEAVSVFIFGENFTTDGTTEVYFNGVRQFLVAPVTTDMMIVRIPTVTSNLFGPVTVTTPSDSVTSEQEFGMPLTGLNLTGVWPSTAKVGEWESIFLFGTEFTTDGTTEVYFNGVRQWTVAPVTSEMLIVRVLGDASLSGLVTVVTPSGTVNSSVPLNFQLNNANLNDTYIHKTQTTLLTPTSTEIWSGTNSITFDGNGNCSYTGMLDGIVRTDNITPRTVVPSIGNPSNGLCTYNLTGEGQLTIKSDIGITSYSVNPDTKTIVGINTISNTGMVGSIAETMIKQSVMLNNANLNGTYQLSAESMVLTSSSTEVWSWGDSITFDGNGNCSFIGIFENSTIRTDDVTPRTVESFTETPDNGLCTYNLAGDGTLTINGNTSYVFNPDNEVITGNNYFNRTDVVTSVEVMVNQSSGLSNASLNGIYMVTGRETDLTDLSKTQFWIWEGNMTFDGNGNCNYTGTLEEGVIRREDLTPRTTLLFVGAPDNSSCTYSLATDGELTLIDTATGATASYMVNHDATIISGTNIFPHAGGVTSSVIERMIKSSSASP